ncbi:MAG: 50S ribosomal protein L13 [Holophagaceae bacterium]|jgi:large subunit ribosomal protein L13|nr:50S ribosomal protein L13 [Acidobacteriota bacterium]
MGTFFPSAKDIKRQWFLVDASGVSVGRVSSVVAELLAGKHKPTWTPFLDTGDHVVVINAEKAVFTGKKATQKIYRTTTTQPGSMKEVKAGVLREAHPTRAIEKAVKGMLPKGPLGNAMLKKLIVYAGTDHQQKAQNPIAFSLKK